MAKLAPEIINQIPVLYKKYGVKKKVAEELGISVSSVSKYLNITEAMPASTEKKPRVKITDEVITQINELYSEYKNMSKVAKELGIAATTVKKYLNEENLQLQKNTNEDRDALWYYIFRLFGQNSEDKPVSDWNVT
jgi:predicted transcriptional regulator